MKNQTRISLFNLETRLLREQLIEFIKILKGTENVQYSIRFSLNTNYTRNNSIKPVSQQYRMVL